VDGVLTEGRNLPGRGAYTCDRSECFEQAVERRAFRRAVRAEVTIGPGLARIYTGRSDG